MRKRHTSLHTDAVASYLNVQITADMYKESRRWIIFKLSTKLLCKWWPIGNCKWQDNKMHMAGAFTRSELCMQFSYDVPVNFKVGSECLLQGISCISCRTAVWTNAKICLHVYMYLILCLLCRGRVSVQQFWVGVVLRMCRGLTITLFVRFFDKYYVATIDP